MSDRYEDSNWGKHGNPNREDWYRTPRGLRELPLSFHNNSLEESSDNDTKISVSTIFWILGLLLLLSGVSETVRELVYEGRTWADIWYSSIDNLLDTLGAPKLP